MKRCFSERLLGIRKELELTQEELARQTGLSPSCVCKLETDQKDPTLPVVAAYEALLRKHGRLKRPFRVRDWVVSRDSQ
jgi:predicted transcriptional regulator